MMMVMVMVMLTLRVISRNIVTRVLFDDVSYL
jgi:hypothetical protein